MNGIDIYNGNDVTDFNALKNQGVEILIHKATEGLTFRDFRLPTRYPNMQNLFKLGYYHFAKGNKPEDEAQFFLNTIAGYRSDTVLWLDIEGGEYVWTKSWAIAYTNAFINYLKSKGHKVGIYTGEYFYNDYLKGNIPADVVLWIANYSRQPKTYPTHSWQYSESGKLSGISGNVDLNNFVSNIFVDGSVVSMSIPSVDNTVKVIQQQLNDILGISLKVDGVLGPLTLEAIKTFQSKYGLKIDGVWGPLTAGKATDIIKAKQAAQIKPQKTSYSVQYQAHVQNTGWQNTVKDWEVAGTTGKSLRLEALTISDNSPYLLKFEGHIQSYGWTSDRIEGEINGTVGQSRRLEAIKIWLEGAPKNVHVEYQAHVQSIGWQNVVRDGAVAGTTGKSLRLEAIRIRIVED